MCRGKKIKEISQKKSSKSIKVQSYFQDSAHQPYRVMIKELLLKMKERRICKNTQNL
jgi:hypothetical protein